MSPRGGRRRRKRPCVRRPRQNWWWVGGLGFLCPAPPFSSLDWISQLPLGAQAHVKETEPPLPISQAFQQMPVPSYSPLTYGSISPSSSDVASSELPTVSNPVVRSEKRLPIPATTDSRGCLPTQGRFPPPWRALRKEGREGSLFIRGMSVCFSSSPRQTSGRLKFIRAHSFPTRHQKSAVPVFTGL